MEKLLNLHIEKLPEGYYFVTSDTVQGLAAQGRTINEAIEIARDIAKKLIEAQAEVGIESKQSNIDDSFDYPLPYLFQQFFLENDRNFSIFPKSLIKE